MTAYNSNPTVAIALLNEITFVKVWIDLKGAYQKAYFPRLQWESIEPHKGCVNLLTLQSIKVKAASSEPVHRRVIVVSR